jgi:hypothetical protein
MGKGLAVSLILAGVVCFFVDELIVLTKNTSIIIEVFKECLLCILNMKQKR